MFSTPHQLLLFPSIYLSQWTRKKIIFLEENGNKAKGSKATTIPEQQMAKIFVWELGNLM